MPRRIEVPSADALFGGGARAPREDAPAPRTPAEGAAAGVEVMTPPRPPRRRRAPGGAADEGVLRRLDQLEAALGDLPVDRLIAVRERLELLLAASDVDAAALRSLLELGGG